MNLRMKQWSLIVVPLSLASVGLHAETVTLPWELNTNDYEGFYVYGQIGHASSDISRNDVEEGLQGIDSSIESVWIEEGSEAWSAGAGYFFIDWLSVELGWTDLGGRDVELDEDSSFPSSGSDYYPQSGHGLSLAAIGHIPMGSGFYIAPKLGVFAWEDNAPADNDGTDLWYGAEINYRLDESVSIFAGWQQFAMERQDVDLISIGLRYRFGDTDPEPVAQSVPVVEKELDSDGDGIIDKLDQCPGTPKIYQVDEHGCILYAEERFEYRLVINYANDSAIIDSRYDEKIQELFEFMADHDIKNIHVEGHTSAPGSESYNQLLSLRRAKSVINVLSEKYGMSKDIFIPVGKGESQLLDMSATPEADEINRRTEVSAGKVIRKEVLR